MRRSILLLAGLAFAVSALANDFPTLARVEFVLGCMNRIGNQNYDTMYQCTCSADKIAERLSYEDYTEATVFTLLRSTPGEKGGVFRDPPHARKLRKALSDAVEYAEVSCFLKASN